MTDKKIKTHYVDNKRMYTALVKLRTERDDARAEGRQDPRTPEYIGECIWLIATRLSSRGNFSSYIFVEELVGDGIENACAAVPTFDPDKSTNPHAYFTMVIWRAFLRRIAKEKKQLYVKYKVAEAAAPWVQQQMGDAGEAMPLDSILDNPYLKQLALDTDRAMAEKKAEKKAAASSNVVVVSMKDYRRRKA